MIEQQLTKSTSKADTLQNEARALLAPFGLLPFGWFRDEDGTAGLLVGNIGSSLWTAFKVSGEFSDGQNNGLDRWTETSLRPIARTLDAELRFPFGEIIWPFQKWAGQATGMKQSPIGLFIHPEYGLWTAFRGALMFDADIEFEAQLVSNHPCDSCVEKPCLTTCPIGAFTAEGYDYLSCKSHVRSEAGDACRRGSCLARKSCPIGTKYTYEQDHQAFHMAAYI